MATDASTPERMLIANLKTGEEVSAQFNPEEVKEAIQVNYEKLDIQGLSHQPRQYKNTGNLGISFELGFDQMSFRNVELGGTAVGGGDPQLMRRYLLSLCYSSRQAQTVTTGEPPRLLFVWPEMWVVQCQLDKLEFTHRRFRKKGLSTLFTASLSLEQVSDQRIFSEDVFEHGTLRSSSGGRAV